MELTINFVLYLLVKKRCVCNWNVSRLVLRVFAKLFKEFQLRKCHFFLAFNDILSSTREQTLQHILKKNDFDGKMIQK